MDPFLFVMRAHFPGKSDSELYQMGLFECSAIDKAGSYFLRALEIYTQPLSKEQRDDGIFVAVAAVQAGLCPQWQQELNALGRK